MNGNGLPSFNRILLQPGIQGVIHWQNGGVISQIVARDHPIIFSQFGTGKGQNLVRLLYCLLYTSRCV